jgi:hypothetical protein
MTPHRAIRVPRYLAPLARKIRGIEKTIEKSLILDSPDVFPELLPDGRVRLGLRSGALGAATAIPLLLVRPTTLNTVISAGTAIGLWPRLGVAVPTTLNEVITAGTTIGLWPTPMLLTPGTLNEVITAGSTLRLWS